MPSPAGNSHFTTTFMHTCSQEEAQLDSPCPPLKPQETLPLPSREEDGEQKSSRAAWAVTSVIGIALSCVVSVTVPFFDIIVAAIGALGDLAAAYALPALFVLASSPAPWLCHAGLTHC